MGFPYSFLGHFRRVGHCGPYGRNPHSLGKWLPRWRRRAGLVDRRRREEHYEPGAEVHRFLERCYSAVSSQSSPRESVVSPRVVPGRQGGKWRSWVCRAVAQIPYSQGRLSCRFFPWLNRPLLCRMRCQMEPLRRLISSHPQEQRPGACVPCSVRDSS